VDFSELLRHQAEFDLQHRGETEFYVQITEERIDVLEHLLVCLIGEVGEVANIVKKVVRGDHTYASKRAELTDELADIFAYILKLANQLNIDLEQAYLNKMEQNRKRFRHYKAR